MTGWSLPMQVVLEQGEALAGQNQHRPLLILGEGGSGRTCLAQSLHVRMDRPPDRKLRLYPELRS